MVTFWHSLLTLFPLLLFSFFSLSSTPVCVTHRLPSLWGVPVPWHGSVIVTQSQNAFTMEHLVPRVCIQPHPRQCPLSFSAPPSPSQLLLFLKRLSTGDGCSCVVVCSRLPTQISEPVWCVAHLMPSVPQSCQLYSIHYPSWFWTYRTPSIDNMKYPN